MSSLTEKDVEYQGLNMNTYIHVQFDFEGLHCWPDAPDLVAFLRNPHRHDFHGHAHIQVKHDDRELEFILVKRYIEDEIVGRWPYNLGAKSCEMMAREIIEELLHRYGDDRNMKVEVLEDGENGSIVKYKGS